LECAVRRKSNWKNIAVPAAVFTVAVSIFFVFWHLSERHENAALDLKTSLTAQQVAIRLEDYISVRLYVAASLRLQWGKNITSYESYQEHASNVVNTLGGLLALNWVDPGGVIRWVVPEAPNLPAKNQDLTINPIAGPILRRAKESGEMKVSPPLTLYQGGLGVVAYIPIESNGKNAGFLNAVFRLAPMIEHCLARGVEENFSFLVSESNELIYASEDPYELMERSGLVAEDFRVGDRTWTVTLAPKPHVVASAQTRANEFTLALGFVVALAGALLSWRVLVNRTKLKESEARYRRIIETAREGIWTIDGDANTSFVNDRMAEMLGYTVTDMMGRSFLDFVNDEARVEAESNLERRRAGIADTYEFRLSRKDGTDLWTIMSTNPFYDKTGRYIGSLAMVSDISQRKRVEQERRDMEAQFRHTQKLESMGVLAGGIAHDFNNLLTGIIGNAGMALEDATVSNTRESILEIDTAARRASGLCQQLLAYSGRGKYIIESIDLNSLVKEMGALIGVSTTKKADVEYDLDDELPRIDADASQIGQIIMNLITNASEALGSETGVIFVRTGSMDCDAGKLRETYLSPDLPAGEYVFIEVSDTGSGMDADTVERIFDPFFTTKFVGRGLGLAAVLGIIRGHNGAIEVDSEMARGTTIRVFLPAGEKQSDEPERPTLQESIKDVNLSGRTIMVVDDEEYVRSLVRRMLEPTGVRVLIADNGHRAIELVRERGDDIDCIVMDVTMPDMDGPETFRRLRRARSNIRIIITSGYSQQDVAQKFEGKGVSGFLSKPFRREDLTGVLSRALDTTSHPTGTDSQNP
jgi:PAS domain S-box-containing protein